jgi:hypothetical protein
VSTGSAVARPGTPASPSALSMASAVASPEPRTAARSDGPAPERTQPSAPASSAARRDRLHPGKKRLTLRLVQAVLHGECQQIDAPRHDGARRSPRRWRLNTGVRSGNGRGENSPRVPRRAFRLRHQDYPANLCGYGQRYGGHPVAHRAGDRQTSEERGRDVVRMALGPRGQGQDCVAVERRAEATLAAIRPPTQAAALEPRPRAGGIRFTQRMVAPGNRRPAAS